MERERPEDADPRALLDRGLRELGLAAALAQREALIELARLLDRWCARINLTGHRGLLEIVRRLLLDSAALMVQLPEIQSLADLGSGAGFPGFPVAILRPQCRVTLIEPRIKRHHFQREVCRALGLANAAPVRGRGEDVEPFPHAAVIAQAVARPAVALKLMLPWLAPDGIAVVPGGAEPPEIGHPGVRLEGVVRYRVPCGGPERTLWLGRRRALWP